jgi:hypothetical protein
MSVPGSKPEVAPLPRDVCSAPVNGHLMAVQHTPRLTASLRRRARYVNLENGNFGGEVCDRPRRSLWGAPGGGLAHSSAAIYG